MIDVIGNISKAVFENYWEADQAYMRGEIPIEVVEALLPISEACLIAQEKIDDLNSKST